MIVPTYETTAKEQEIIINNQRKEIERLQDMDKILRNENINLKLRINKAIEYIESYMPNYDFDKTNLIKLLEILDKEN